LSLEAEWDKLESASSTANNVKDWHRWATGFAERPMLQIETPGKAVQRMRWGITLSLLAIACGATEEPGASCPVPKAGVPEGSGPITYSGMTSGQNGTCVVASNGTVQCWEYGHQGEASEVSEVTNARRVVVGDDRLCASRDGGSVVCWTDAGPRKEVHGLCGATELAAGHLLTCAVATRGEVLCEGLVTGLRSGYSEDVLRIPDVTGATELATGPNGYTCALLEEGSVTCWGGGPRPEDRPGVEPAPISEISGALAIAGSEGFDVCALLADQSVSCWNPSTAPVPVEGLSQVTSLSVGPRHGCASLSDGTVRCWGANSYGELGNGTQTDSNVAVQVEQLEGVGEVSVGTRGSPDMGFSCALRTEGSVACWGAKTQITATGDWIASSTPVSMRLP